MAASLAHWFINAPIALPHIHRVQVQMIQKVTAMITLSVEFLLRHQAALINRPIYTPSPRTGSSFSIFPVLTRVVPFITSRFFYWRMITLNDVKRGEKRSTGIMTWRWGGKRGVGGGVDAFLSARPRKLSRILAHPLFKTNRTLLATMDLIIIPMSILNMWHKYRSRGLSIKE